MLLPNITLKHRKPLSQNRSFQIFHSPRHGDHFRHEHVARTEPSGFSHRTENDAFKEAFSSAECRQCGFAFVTAGPDQSFRGVRKNPIGCIHKALRALVLLDKKAMERIQNRIIQFESDPTLTASGPGLTISNLSSELNNVFNYFTVIKKEVVKPLHLTGMDSRSLRA